MVLELENLTKKYGKFTALNEFSFKFVPGVYGILGPNGAGKSTLMNLITCNLKPTSGKIFLDGKDVFNSKRKYVGLIGYMPQQQTVYSNLTLNRFMFYMASLKGLKRRQASYEIEKLLERVNLIDVRHRYMGQFSGGMKQRALIAQALLADPSILVLDEPTAGLDPKERVAVRNLIKEISKEKIVLMSTHVVSDIEPIADDILIMKGGRIISEHNINDQNADDDLEKLYMQLFP